MKTTDKRSDLVELAKKLKSLGITPTVPIKEFAKAVKAVNPLATTPVESLPDDVKATIKGFKQKKLGFHGAKLHLNWFPAPLRASACGDKFGYLTSQSIRDASKLDFNVVTMNLLNQLGNLMGDTGRETGILDSIIPAGYTYFGQFVDHDITLDVSSSIEEATDATTISNMRSPLLDLDNVYGRGPALEPYLYVFPSTGPATAIKLKLGRNRASGRGGPSTSGGGPAGMVVKTDFDVPRIDGTNTAVIGDPRNDENLFVSQFQMAMLRFHNAVVDIVVAAGFTGDIFVEAKRVVTHHYQWALVNDFLKRICGAAAVDNALGSVAAPVGSAFSMPVEFSVAAYRVFNNARKIDTVLASGLESLPNTSGIMSVLAARNLRRGLAFGLPSGQATATALGITPLTAGELTGGLPPNEAAILNSNGGLLLNRTPLWYYVLREAAVVSSGDKLGPLGAKIVAETFVRMLKRDGDSYLNRTGGFVPFLPADSAGDFTVTDIIKFSGANVP